MLKNDHGSFKHWAVLCRALTRFSILALFFLIPLVFAPFTLEALELNKQMVLVVLAFFAAGGWLGVAAAERHFVWRGGWLINALPVVWLGANLASTILSLAGRESWFGYGGQEYLSFLTTTALVVVFYVLVNVCDPRLVRQSILALILSTSLIALISLLSLINIHLLPFLFTHTVGFNTIGNINAFAAWLIPVSLIGLGCWLVPSDGQNSLIPKGPAGVIVRSLIGLICAVTLLLLAAIDFWPLWVALLLGLSALMCVSWFVPQQIFKPQRLVVPLALVLTAIIFLLFKTPLNLQVPVVVSPSMTTSGNIVLATLGQNVSRALFGSGPGSFELDYARYRPLAVNNTIFWNTRFDRAQIHPLTLLATTGAVGFVSWITILLVISAIGSKHMMRALHEPALLADYVLAIGWVSLLSVCMLTPANMSFTVLFWSWCGLVASRVAHTTHSFAWHNKPRVALAFTSGLILFAVASSLFLSMLGSRYVAEIAFAQATRLSLEDAPPQQLIDKMVKAVELDSSNAVYQRNLATAYLAEAGQLVSESLADDDFSSQDRQTLAKVADAAIRAAARAAVLGEHDSANWSINGLIYRELMPFIQNAQNYAASMYAKALELEPNNPVYQTDFGRVYLAVADRARDLQKRDDLDSEAAATAAMNEAENLNLAAQNLEKAIRLKPDYAPAHYYLAATYERQGRLLEAAERLELLTRAEARDVGLGFQLAIIYIKLNHLDGAEAELERVLAHYPDYSNAMWYLAAIKADKAEIDEALQLLRRILVLNPDNQAVKSSLINLETGGNAPKDPGPIDSGLSEDTILPSATLPVL